MLKHLRTFVLLSTVAVGLVAGTAVTLIHDVEAGVQLAGDGGVGIDPND